MNRRWQKEASGRLDSLESFVSLTSRLQPLAQTLGLADPADIYSTYSVLHSKGRNPQLHTNQPQGFHYFMADAIQPGPGASTEEREVCALTH